MTLKSSKRTSRTDLPDAVLVGRILRPQGVRGEVMVEVLSDVPGRIAPGQELLATRDDGRPAPVPAAFARLKVASCRRHPKGLLVRFEGIEDRDRAEEVRGVSLAIERSKVPPAPPGTYYHYELLGCRCRAGEEELGEVVDLLEDGGGLILIVEKPGRRVPVPFVQRFIRAIDVAGGTIDFDLPPGLVEECASTS